MSSDDDAMSSHMTPEQRESVTTALFAYWTARSDAAAAQAAKGGQDVGGRAGVTAGAHMDRIAQLLGLIAIEAGAPPGAVYYKAPPDDPHKRSGATPGYTLPGWYRPTKEWDVVVYAPGGLPCVAIELKSQNGPSYGNNANNRAEEAIGNAVDLKRAMDEGLVPGNPWLGYAYVIEDDDASRGIRGKKGELSVFAIDAIFTDWTYQDRVRLLCQRLVEDKHYDSSWAVSTSRPDCAGTESCAVLIQRSKIEKRAARNRQPAPPRLPHEHIFDWTELDEARAGFVQFTAAMAERIRSHYPQAGDATPVSTLAVPQP